METKHKGFIKSPKGITLIALVITIIVLLILAGVALSALLGDSGIITNAEKAKENTAKGNAREQLGLAVQQALIEGEGEIKNATHLNNELNQILGTTGKEYVTGETAPFKVTVNGDEFKVQGNGKIEIDEPMKDYASTAKDAKGLLTANATFTSNGLTAVVPKGFKIVNGSEGTQSIAAGLVIQDAKENEFVWIPVTYEGTEDADNNGYYDAFEEVFRRFNFLNEAESYWSEYSEPYSQGYTNDDGTTEADDYNDMMLSVQKNKGFYIGRYEAGIDVATGSPRRYNQENPDSTVVVKKNAYPYNYVAWGKNMNDYTTPIKYDFEYSNYSESGYDQGHGAMYLSKHLLDGQTTGATSTLCYGVQWDAMLNFIDAYTDKDINNSISWGNHLNNTFTFTGKYLENSNWKDANNLQKPENKSWLLTTGASETNQAQNIYDVAGNVSEYTMETQSSYYRVCRGDTINTVMFGNNYYNPASCRFNDDGYPYSTFIGFRPALYITN